jgi:hypothetical protein
MLVCDRIAIYGSAKRRKMVEDTCEKGLDLTTVIWTYLS